MIRLSLARWRRRVATTMAALLFAAVGIQAIIAAPASAEVLSNACSTASGLNGSVCLYYRSNYGGAKAGFRSSPANVYDYYGMYYPGPGDGAGTRIWNNAGSGWNFSTTLSVRIYYSAGYQGVSQALDPAGYIFDRSYNLGPVNNDNRSHKRFSGCIICAT